MSERRRARLNEQMKREIAELLRSEVDDPRVGLPTVTRVDVTADLWLARIYVRPGPTDPDASLDEILGGLEAAAPFIRRALGRMLTLRRVPELRFLPDRTLEDALRIEQILREVLPDAASGEAAPPGGSGGGGSVEGDLEASRPEEGPA